ncbi:rRNA maturation RNase YbeY [Flavisphingomonas formosensis]|uniref:rRNA maturation RNase YbeY n=1 Tax=Flavisphingomonas formosensis TaxID=861534 RepID=UPI0012FAFED1|nr:rRNA maturation RNase YbeY [Sphingomonas formosensis]
MIDVAVQIEPGWPADVDWEALASEAVAAALGISPYAWIAERSFTAEIAVRLTSDEEVHSLNKSYRGKDKPTNVLSFPMVQEDLIDSLANSDDGEVLMGDIVLAAGVCAAEAADKGVSVAHHATHLIVHGTLHLLGYDHQGDAEAEAMEALERVALATLGIADPYAVDEA